MVLELWLLLYALLQLPMPVICTYSAVYCILF